MHAKSAYIIKRLNDAICRSIEKAITAKLDLGICSLTLQVCPLYSCNCSPVDLSQERIIKHAGMFTHGKFNKMIQTYLSRRRKVESKQPARTQLPSFDIDIQLTGCPKLSDISLAYRRDNISWISQHKWKRTFGSVPFSSVLPFQWNQNVPFKKNKMFCSVLFSKDIKHRIKLM